MAALDPPGYPTACPPPCRWAKPLDDLITRQGSTSQVKRPVYMDHHATTPVDPRVLAAMVPYFSDTFGNAASQHAFGWAANAAVDLARERVQALIGAARPSEIIFLSGATEASNLALKGASEVYRERRDHVVTVATEHHAVLDVCHRLKQRGMGLTVVVPESDGIVDPAQIERAITERTLLVSVMLANNEIGAVQPLEQIGAITRERGVLLHTDACQGLGKIPFNVEHMNVDLASLSGHKIYGPKGVGALYVRSSKPRVRLLAEIDGGGQERSLRSGTVDVPAVVGLGVACQILAEEGAREAERLARLRDRLFRSLTESLEGTKLNGPERQRLPENLNLSFSGTDSAGLLSLLQRNVAVSSGAACTSLSLEPSHVVRAIAGLERARSSLRFGLGRSTTEEEVDFVAERVVAAVRSLRG